MLPLQLDGLWQWVHFLDCWLWLDFFLGFVVACRVGVFPLYLVVYIHNRVKNGIRTGVRWFLGLCIGWLGVVDARHLVTCHLIRHWLLRCWLAYERSNFLSKHLHVLARKLRLTRPIFFWKVVFDKLPLLGGA